MKFLLALLMLLTLASCTDTESEDFVFDQEHIDVTLEPEALYCAMNERDVIGVRETSTKYLSYVAPIMYQSEEKGYLLFNAPRDVILKGDDAFKEYLSDSEAQKFIEIYATPDCKGEPEKIVNLT